MPTRKYVNVLLILRCPKSCLKLGPLLHGFAAQINDIIVKYIPTKYMVKSTNEFLSIVSDVEYSENMLLASLDVESLFTNVPVYDTIDIILKNVSQHSNVLQSLESTKKDLLTLCTTQTPLRNFNGELCLQIDGVLMGSSLGPTFANYYKYNLEDLAC